MPASPLHASPLGPAPFAARLPDVRDFALKRVRSRDEWARVRELRHEGLSRRGDIAPRAERSFPDSHDAALNSMTFLLYDGDCPIGTTRSSVRSAERRWPLPAAESFAAEIDASVGFDATVVEASLAVVDPRASVDAKLALIHLFRAHMLHCAAEDADWLLAAVRDSQIGFYRRMFGMEILSGAEPVRGLALPRVLMGLRYREQAPLLVKRIPALAAGRGEEREMGEGDGG